jgi:CBS domain-containing protein
MGGKAKALPTVEEIMEEQVITVAETATITEAAKKMADDTVGTVLVLDKKNRLAGLATDRKISQGTKATYCRITQITLAKFSTTSAIPSQKYNAPSSSTFNNPVE